MSNLLKCLGLGFRFGRSAFKISVIWRQLLTDFTPLGKNNNHPVANTLKKISLRYFPEKLTGSLECLQALKH